MSQIINDSTTIKLFGRTIFLTHNIYVSTNDSSSKFAHPLPHEDFSDHSLHSSLSSCSPLEVNSPAEHMAKRYKKPSSQELTSEEEDDDDVSQQTIEDLNTPSAEAEVSQQNSTKVDEQSDMPQDKSPTKPDIIVPCPRCKSMNTKFCYYNNYNVKQPRHYCKSCQRYWTSGGTARKMLVGAGRRKNKVASNFSFDVSRNPQINTVLTFGSNSSDMSSTSPDKNLNDGSHKETFDKSYQSCPQQFPWNPAMCYPVSFYPNMSYYGGFLQPLWNVQSVPTQSCGANKPALGKHSRDGDNEGRIFKGFGSNCDDKNHVVESSSSVLKANPAALSRSIVFNEII